MPDMLCAILCHYTLQITPKHFLKKFYCPTYVYFLCFEKNCNVSWKKKTFFFQQKITSLCKYSMLCSLGQKNFNYILTSMTFFASPIPSPDTWTNFTNHWKHVSDLRIKTSHLINLNLSSKSWHWIIIIQVVSKSFFSIFVKNMKNFHKNRNLVHYCKNFLLSKKRILL